MATLTITARAQVTFRKDVLHRLGIRPGEKIELDKLPDGRVALRAAKPSSTVDGFLGPLDGKSETEGRTTDLLSYRAQAPSAAANHPADELPPPLFVALGAAGPNPRVHTSTTYGFLRMDALVFH